MLNLQAIIDQCYRNGGYDDIDYRGEPDPPLSPKDAAWADELLKKMATLGRLVRQFVFEHPAEGRRKSGRSWPPSSSAGSSKMRTSLTEV